MPIRRWAINMIKRRTVPALAVLLLATWLGSARAADSSTEADAAYIQSFEKWKAAETDDLKTNWLPLVGLFWLKPGVNAFGSDPSNAIVFPKGPAHAGEFDLDGKDVTLKLLPETRASIEGSPMTQEQQAALTQGLSELLTTTPS